MSNLYYLGNTLDNIQGWFNGFCTHMHDFIDEDTDFEMHQLVLLYEMQIDEIIAHAQSLVREMKNEGESVEK